jgi:hypothetical protein
LRLDARKLCKNCAQIMRDRGRCRHVEPSSGAVFATANRTPFYMHGAPVSDADPGHAFHGPSDYLEEAIRTGASDLLLEWLQTPGAVFPLAMLELHHQRHGAVLWPQCPDRECNLEGLKVTDIVVAQIAALQAAVDG